MPFTKNAGAGDDWSRTTAGSNGFQAACRPICQLSRSQRPCRRYGPVQIDGPQQALLQDARLNSVSFASATHGWAVGDRGAIWHTPDAGTHWQLQQSGVHCRLTSVQFLDQKNGWAAGGYTEPYTHTTSGVVLRTKDGGRTWKEVPKLQLPAISRIQFFDHAKGWAVTQPSAMFPAGVFSTEDGGRSWAAPPAAEGQTWLSGDFVDAQNGVLIGQQGSIATVRGKTAERTPSAPTMACVDCIARCTKTPAGWSAMAA